MKLIVSQNQQGSETIEVRSERQARALLRARYGMRRLPASYPTETGIGIPLSPADMDGTDGEEWAEIVY